MSSLGSALGRLRGRSSAELTERFRQAMSARAERYGLGASLGLHAVSLVRILAPGEPSELDALLSRTRTRSAPRTVPGLVEAAATAAVVKERYPADSASLLARAQQIANGRFELMGHTDIAFGNPIDWHLDPIAGLRAPLSHWSAVPYLDASIVGDHKVVWELNRHQWIVTLGQAYALTGDEQWAIEILTHLERWLDANPAKLGINWASSLEVAFRAISWLTVLSFLRSSPSLTPVLYGRLLESLHVHGRHLETYLSTYFSPNTHLTGEALGLFYLGTLLPELRAAPRWQRRGLAVLEAQLPIHVHPDGVYFEQATQYHRYTTDFYLHLVLLADANGVTLAPHVRPKLEQLFEHLLYLSRPDGTIPLLGDDDGGRLMQLDGRTPDDVRSLLAAGAVLFGRDDFAFAARGDLAGMIWLLGPEGLERFERLQPKPPAELARPFLDGGYYMARDSWNAGSDWLAFDCGPHGVMNAGHAHADALALELVVAGRPVFVDSGTYTYPGPERNAFRGTAAHNTVTIDWQSSSVPSSGPFRWESMAEVRAESWHASARGVLVAGSHNGFESLAAPARHQRSILRLHGDYWVIRDRIASSGSHEIAVRFHCAPGLDSCVASDAGADAAAAEIVEQASGNLLLRVASFGRNGKAIVEDGWVSPQYGARQPSRVLVWRQEGTGNQEVVTFLLPPHHTGEAAVSEVSGVVGGRGFLVRTVRGDDLLLLKDGSGPVRAEGVQTDAMWLWLRRDSEGRLSEYVAIDASYARVGDDTLWADTTRIAWRASAEAGTNDAAITESGS